MIDRNWTVDEAIGADQRARETDPDYEGRRGPLNQWQALKVLDHLEERFRAGDSGAILAAIAECALVDLPLPDWVSVAFLRQYRTVRHYKARNWRDVFGDAHKKNLDIDAARARLELRPQIYSRVVDLVREDPDRPIDDGLFEQVAEDFGIKRTLCSKLFYEAEKQLGGASLAERRRAANRRLEDLSRQFLKSRGNTGGTD